LLILEPQPSADGGVGDSVLGLSQGSARGLDIEAILGLLDQALEEFEVLKWDEGRGILPASMDNDPLPLILRAVQDFGERLSKLDHVEPYHRAFSIGIYQALVVGHKIIMYMMGSPVNPGLLIEEPSSRPSPCATTGRQST
jgi:hypothetical protein